MNINNTVSETKVDNITALIKSEIESNKTTTATIIVDNIISNSNSSTLKNNLNPSKVESKKVEKIKSFIKHQNSRQNFVQQIKSKKTIVQKSEHRKGRLWWIWAIGVFLSLLIALLISAYGGFIFATACTVFTIIFLIKFIKSKPVKEVQVTKPDTQNNNSNK